MMFRSFSNISKFFLRDYGTIAMVIILVTMVTITTVISSRVKIYMLFTGREVRMGKNCARGLEFGPRGRRPRAVLKTKGTVFSHTDRPSPVNNMFIFFLQ